MSEADYLKLAELTQRSFFNRRELEWKLAFGFWTAIASFTAALLFRERLSLPEDAVRCLRWIYAFVWTCSLIGWKFPLQRAHAGDKAWYRYYTNRARGESDTAPQERNCCGQMRCVNCLWLFGQAAFSGVFLCLSWLLIAAKYAPTLL